MTTNKFKNLYNISIIIIFLIVIFFIFGKFNILDEIKKIQPLYILPIALLSILVIYLNGIFLKITASIFSINLREHFLIALSSSFFNLIMPLRSGLLMRAIYLKKKYSYSYVNFAASIFGNYVILFLTASILAMVLLTVMYFTLAFFNIWFFLIFLTLFLSTILTISLNITLKSQNFLIQKINKVIKGWRLIASSRKTVFKLSLNALLTFIIQALIIKFTFLGLGLKISLIQGLFMSVMNLLAAFVNITPGSIGLTEALYVISGSGVGISPSVSLVASLIIRAINTLVLLALGPVANWILLKKAYKT